MKILSKRQGFSLLGSLATIIAVMALPSATYAAATTSSSSAACTKLASLAATSTSTIDNHIATMHADFANRLTTIDAKEANVDKAVAADRAKASSAFQAKITNMEAQTGLTVAQHAAIESYQTKMVAANTVRISAVDAARATYRTALKAAVDSRQSQLNGSVDAYRSAVADAFTTAASNCGDGNARTTLKGSIKAAHQTLDSARQADKIKASIQQLAATRDASIKAADSDFAASAKTYTATLVAVLKASPNQ
ncbi:MAG: surface antigen [Candidatus Saccharibacteria bacterium]|nr:surface antigen [Candidatus Saccharibacteria bacterium]